MSVGEYMKVKNSLNICAILALPDRRLVKGSPPSSLLPPPPSSSSSSFSSSSSLLAKISGSHCRHNHHLGHHHHPHHLCWLWSLISSVIVVIVVIIIIIVIMLITFILVIFVGYDQWRRGSEKSCKVSKTLFDLRGNRNWSKKLRRAITKFKQKQNSAEIWANWDENSLGEGAREGQVV